MNKKIRTVLIDDHKLLRNGLKSLFENDDNIIVVAESETGKEGVDKTLIQKPDVVIVDLGLNDMSGIDVIKTINDNLPKTKIVVLSSHDGQNEVFDALSNGANAYVLKDIEDKELLFVIKTVAKGAFYLDPKIADFAKNILQGFKFTEQDEGLLIKISENERFSRKEK